MPYIPAIDVAQIKMNFLSEGEKASNVYYAHRDGGWGLADLQALAEVVDAWEAANGSDIRGTGTQLVTVDVTDLTSLDAFRYSLRSTEQGNVTEESAPGNVTFAVEANTAKRGKGRNGRDFWIGLTKPMLVGDTLDVAIADSIVDALNLLRDAVNGMEGGAELVVLHSVLNKVVLNPKTWDVVNGYTYRDLTLDSQRDRLPNHKRHKKPRTP